MNQQQKYGMNSISNEQKLKEAIEHAVERGWQGLEMWSKTYTVSYKPPDPRVWIEYKDGDGELFIIEQILFSHSFWKAISKGKECTCIPKTDSEGIYHKSECEMTTPDWKAHISRFATISENKRIDYVYDVVNGKGDKADT